MRTTARWLLVVTVVVLSLWTANAWCMDRLSSAAMGQVEGMYCKYCGIVGQTCVGSYACHDTGSGWDECRASSSSWDHNNGMGGEYMKSDTLVCGVTYTGTNRTCTQEGSACGTYRPVRNTKYCGGGT
jgi:hypothetical protein